MSNILKINSAQKVSIRLSERDSINELFVDQEILTTESHLEKAHRLGVEEGKRAAQMELEAKYENDLTMNLQNINSVVEKMDAQLIEYENAFQKIILETSFMLAEKIIKEKIEQKSTINETIKSAVNKVLGANKFIAKLNPNDYKLLDVESNKLLKEVALSKIKFDNDESIEPGGCFIETDIGNADARISSQLNELKKAFENKIFADDPDNGN